LREFLFALFTFQKTVTFLWYALKTSRLYAVWRCSTTHVRNTVNVVPSSANQKVAILIFIGAVKINLQNSNAEAISPIGKSLGLLKGFLFLISAGKPDILQRVRDWPPSFATILPLTVRSARCG
jgi:hypothetical protein